MKRDWVLLDVCWTRFWILAGPIGSARPSDLNDTKLDIPILSGSGDIQRGGEVNFAEEREGRECWCKAYGSG